MITANIRKLFFGIAMFGFGAMVSYFSFSRTSLDGRPPWLVKGSHPLASSMTKDPGLVVKTDVDLSQEVRVLCWIMTSPDNLRVKGTAVKETWAQKCNKVIFMSSKADASFPAVGLNVEEGHDKLWPKSRKAWYYVYQHHIDDYEWFLKADDDTFVIVENLRYFGSTLNPEEGHYLGRRFKPHGDYNSGGAGYAVSRGALRKLGPTLKDETSCPFQNGAEDAQFSICLHRVGVSPTDTRDGVRERFHPFPLAHHIIRGTVPKDFWYWQYVYYRETTKEGPDCCSDLTISFHYIQPNQMYELYFYVYRLHPYGYFKSDSSLPPPTHLRSRRSAPSLTLKEEKEAAKPNIDEEKLRANSNRLFQN